MAIGIKRDSDATVAKPFTHNLGMNTLPQHKRRMGMPQVVATLVGIKKRKEEEERQWHADLGNLKVRLKEIGYYLRRKRFDTAAKEDPILILQELRVISPMGFHYQGPAKGVWESNGLSGKFEYKPPIKDFVDMVGKTHSYSYIYQGMGKLAGHTSSITDGTGVTTGRSQEIGEQDMI